MPFKAGVCAVCGVRLETLQGVSVYGISKCCDTCARRIKANWKVWTERDIIEVYAGNRDAIFKLFSLFNRRRRRHNKRCGANPPLPVLNPSTMKRLGYAVKDLIDGPMDEPRWHTYAGITTSKRKERSATAAAADEMMRLSKLAAIEEDKREEAQEERQRLLMSSDHQETYSGKIVQQSRYAARE